MNSFAQVKSIQPVLKVVKIYRWNPGCPEKKPHLQTFKINVEKLCGTMVLDVLRSLKDYHDPTLTFRYSCREGLCGSCSMNINGVNGLACITKVVRDAKPLVIYPLPHNHVIRDLVVDMSHFFKQYDEIQPYLIRKDDKTGSKKKDQLQNPLDRKKLDGSFECILCGCCSFGCPSYWRHSDRFLGPASLLHTYRWIVDSRDTGHEERLNKLRNYFSVFPCRAIFNCTNNCPKGLNPARAIIDIKRLLAGITVKQSPKK